MGNKIMELEQLVADIIEKAHVAASEHCDGIRCDQCPFHVNNTTLAARGFLKELIYERGAKVVEE